MCRQACLRAATSAAPRSLSYNPAENAVLLGSDAENGSYELYVVPKDSKGEASPVSTFASCIVCLMTVPAFAPVLQATCCRHWHECNVSGGVVCHSLGGGVDYTENRLKLH